MELQVEIADTKPLVSRECIYAAPACVPTRASGSVAALTPLQQLHRGHYELFDWMPVDRR
jgi:hypothetical protein